MRYPRSCLSQIGMWGRAVKSTSRPSRPHIVKRKVSNRSGHGEIWMDIFREGKRLGRRPALWRRHDLYALDHGAASVVLFATALTMATIPLLSKLGDRLVSRLAA